MKKEMNKKKKEIKRNKVKLGKRRRKIL